MSDPSLTDLEQRVALERAALADTLDQLGTALAPDRLKTEARDTLDRYGRDIGGQLWDATRENPAAFAMLGAGLALLLGNGTRRPDDAARTPAESTPRAVPPTQAMTGFDARVAAADSDLRSRMTGTAPDVPRAERLRAALDQGLDRLTPAARRRVIDARVAAIRAQEAVEKRARRMARKSETLVKDQPIAIGAAALGVGVLLAGILPGTRQEDATLGRRRDAAMRAAKAALAREVDAIRDVARDTRNGAAPAIPS